MLKIADWHKRYEVSFRGGEPKQGDAFRVGPLRFIRLTVHGHQQGAGYRRLLAVAGKKAMEVFGIFCKFLEISGNQPRDKRGTLLNEKGNPATAQDLAFILSVPLGQVENAIKVLCDKTVAWVINTTQLNSTQLNTTQENGNLPKFTEISGKPGNARKYIHGDFVKLTTDEHTKLTEKFGLQGTADWIGELDGYLGSTGKKYASHYRTILNWNRKREREATTQGQLGGSPAAGRKPQTARKNRDYSNQEAGYGDSVDNAD